MHETVRPVVEVTLGLGEDVSMAGTVSADQSRGSLQVHTPLQASALRIK
jgi:hypothetical protein